jgi:hypothetical protein
VKRVLEIVALVAVLPAALAVGCATSIGAGGGPECTSVCSLGSCPGSSTCEQECSLAQSLCATNGQSEIFDAYLSCVAGSTYTCTSNGPEAVACASERQALATCSSPPSPPQPEAGAPDSPRRPPTDSAIPPVGPADAQPDLTVSPPTGCTPQSAVGFSPVAVQPLVAQACSAAQVTALVTACFGAAATSSTCSAFVTNASNESCVECVDTNYSGGTMLGSLQPPPAAVSPWGPLVAVGNLVFENTGACITIADSAYASCGQAINALFQCDYYACDAVCPTTTAQDQAAESACRSAASAGTCSSYANAVDTACGALPDGGGAAAFCLDSNLFTDGTINQVVLQQCGNGM